MLCFIASAPSAVSSDLAYWALFMKIGRPLPRQLFEGSTLKNAEVSKGATQPTVLKYQGVH